MSGLEEDDRFLTSPRKYGWNSYTRSDAQAAALTYDPANGGVRMEMPAMAGVLHLLPTVYSNNGATASFDTDPNSPNRRFAPIVWLDLKSVTLSLGTLSPLVSTTWHLQAEFALIGDDGFVDYATAPSSQLPPELGATTSFNWQLAGDAPTMSPGNVIGATIDLGSIIPAGLSRADLLAGIESGDAEAFATYRWSEDRYLWEYDAPLTVMMAPEPDGAMLAWSSVLFLIAFRLLRPTVAERHRAVEDGLAGL
jgi:hypothetical protein